MLPLDFMATLILQDGTRFQGKPFGAAVDSDGEVVFSTGMAGYPESLTDPSFRGQILTFTYPLVGNYGVPTEERNQWGFSKNLESENIHVRGVIVSWSAEDFSHFTAVSSFHRWLEHHGIPGISGIDTRALTKKLREHGVMLGRIVQDDQVVSDQGSVDSLTTDHSPLITIQDPNMLDLVGEVSIAEPVTYDPEGGIVMKTVVAFDCGMKRNIIRSMLKRGIRVHRVPHDYDLKKSTLQYDGVFISNGPGDPKMCTATIEQIRKSIIRGVPTFGICLGNQLMALAIGGDTFKLKYGHRGCNQPCVEWTENSGQWSASQRCIITSQNHGFAVDEKSLPKGWKVWFSNANDGTVEGIRHESGKFCAVQFHPEATPGPEDANYLFDEFLRMMELK